jgi:hypothetical protein
MQTEVAVEAGIEKLEGMIAESQVPEPKQPRVFELNRGFFTPIFPIQWPPDGEIKVKHRLHRPDADIEAEYKRQSFIQERVQNNGKSTEENSGLNTARQWLWDQVAKEIAGYPGLGADNGEWVELTPQLKIQMRSTDKETAIKQLFECEATVLHKESMRTFIGGEWVVRLRLGSHGAFYASLKLRFREWDESQKNTFEQSASAGGSELQGKTRLVTSSVNQLAFRNLFKGTLIDVKADPEGQHDVITVDGEEFSFRNAERFADAFLGEWQVDVITELVQVWRGK